MASKQTRWIARQLQARLREDRQVMGKMDQPYVLLPLWDIICDYTCEDARVVDAILCYKRGMKIRERDNNSTSDYVCIEHGHSGDIDHNTLSYYLYTYIDNNFVGHPYVVKEEKYGELDVFTYLLMLPFEDYYSTEMIECYPLEPIDVKMRRHLYAEIQ